MININRVQLSRDVAFQSSFVRERVRLKAYDCSRATNFTIMQIARKQEEESEFP